MKTKFFTLAVIGSMAALIGCGPADFSGSTPGTPPDSLIDRDGDLPIDTAQYEWVSYEFIRSVFTDILGVSQAGPTDDPENNPLAYLDARSLQVGGTDYSSPVPDNAVTGSITAPGYKALIFAGVSACGIAVQDNGKMSEFYPDGLGDLDTLYLTFLSRYPTAAEVTTHQAMWATMEQTWTDMLDYDLVNPGVVPQDDLDKYNAATGSTTQADIRKGAASCGILITSLEFLTVN